MVGHSLENGVPVVSVSASLKILGFLHLNVGAPGWCAGDVMDITHAAHVSLTTHKHKMCTNCIRFFPKRDKFAPNRTNLGLFKSRQDEMYCNLILKIPWFLSFSTNVTHLRGKSNSLLGTYTYACLFTWF